jgi:hypothetical protein
MYDLGGEALLWLKCLSISVSLVKGNKIWKKIKENNLT